MIAAPAPTLAKMQPVTFYHCLHCKVLHFQDTDEKLYVTHLYWQSREGRQLLHETQEERRARYGL
jgi:hypothetical protein